MITESDSLEILFIAESKMREAKTKDTICKVYRQFRVWSYVTSLYFEGFDRPEFNCELKLLRNRIIKELNEEEL